MRTFTATALTIAAAAFAGAAWVFYLALHA